MNKSIETAQKRVEQRNYTIRKHTLEYDDVMNKQRQEIYQFRNDILRADDIESLAIELIENVCFENAEKYFHSRAEEGGWDPEGYRQWLMRQFPVSFEKGYFDDDLSEAPDLAQKASEKVVRAFKEKIAKENAKINALRPPHEGMVPPPPAQNALRHLMIRKVDQNWQEHLLTMDHLRVDVNLRSVGQRDPLMEFKHEAFTSFDLFGNKLRSEVTHDLFRFEIVVPDHPTIEELLSRLQMERNRSFLSDLGERVPPSAAENENAPTPSKKQPSDEAEPEEPFEKPKPVIVMPKVGRNDSCPCGSGKKYKKCCGASQDEQD